MKCKICVYESNFTSLVIYLMLFCAWFCTTTAQWVATIKTTYYAMHSITLYLAALSTGTHISGDTHHCAGTTVLAHFPGQCQNHRRRKEWTSNATLLKYNEL